jgi:lipopolysaccharide export system protein LptC
MTPRAIGSSVELLEQRSGQELAAAWPRQRPADARRRSRVAADRHSRRVALLKHVLPVIGAILLVLVAVWPRLGPLWESVRLGFPVIDLREAHELRMLNPRYAGIDRFDRPYVVTSAIGRQVPNRDDLMSLEQPRAEMTMHAGALVVMTAATAMYQAQAQLLDLFDDVTLVHENGTRFVTKTAHVDVSANTAEGHDPVSGHGPSGDITAQGFRILDKGNRVIFAGKSDLLLKGSKPSPAASAPAALPPEIAAAAAQVEAAAAAAPVLEPPASREAVAEPSHLQTAANPAAAKVPAAAGGSPKGRARSTPGGRPGKA